MPAAAATTVASADAASNKPAGSLPRLLLVVIGALALAGIIGSVIYRFGGWRLRRQASDRRRGVNWDNRQQPADDGHVPWAAASAGFTPRAQRARPVEFGFVLPAAARSGDTHADPIDVTTSAPGHADIERADMETETETDETPVAAVNDARAEETADADADAIDIDAITAILERLAKEGPRLTEFRAEAVPGDFAQSRQGRPVARA
jgi:hypothetical protein